MDLTVDHQLQCPCSQRSAIFGSRLLTGRRSPRYYESRAADAHCQCLALDFREEPDTSSCFLPLSVLCPPWVANFARLLLNESHALSTWLEIGTWSSKAPA